MRTHPRPLPPGQPRGAHFASRRAPPRRGQWEESECAGALRSRASAGEGEAGGGACPAAQPNVSFAGSFVLAVGLGLPIRAPSTLIPAPGPRLRPRGRNLVPCRPSRSRLGYALGPPEGPCSWGLCGTRHGSRGRSTVLRAAGRKLQATVEQGRASAYTAREDGRLQPTELPAGRALTAAFPGHGLSPPGTAWSRASLTRNSRALGGPPAYHACLLAILQPPFTHTTR